MKIVAILENSISDGGGFNQALNAIIQMNRIKGSIFSFSVLTSNESNISILNDLGINVKIFKKSFFDKVIAGLSTNELTRRFQQKIKIIGPLEKRLINMKCDLVYFVSPSSRVASLQILNYILTVWDNAHRGSPEFPEVRSFGEFQRREYIYNNYIAPSYFTIVDSEQLADKIHARYGVDRERLVVMPFSINPIMEFKSDKALSVKDILSLYNINKGYFFYPAQFWPHKNHVRILEALALLRDRGEVYKVVFVGGEKGGLEHIKELIKKLHLLDQVTILGFVDSSHMPALYNACSAVVIPTYFGYTNIPPIEAWYFNKPLLYSDYFIEQVQDSALLFNPDEASELAELMSRSLELSVSQLLVENGKKSLTELGLSRKNSEKLMLTHLKRFKKRLQCWKI